MAADGEKLVAVVGNEFHKTLGQLVMDAAHEHEQFVGVARFEVVHIVETHFCRRQSGIVETLYAVFIGVAATIEIEFNGQATEQKVIASDFFQPIGFQSQLFNGFEYGTYVL